MTTIVTDQGIEIIPFGLEFKILINKTYFESISYLSYSRAQTRANIIQKHNSKLVVDIVISPKK